MNESVGSLQHIARVRAGGILLLCGAVAMLGWLLQIGNSYVYDASGRNAVAVIIHNELGAELSIVFTALAGYLFMAAAICLSGSVSGRGARLVQAGVILLGLLSMQVAITFATTGPLLLLTAAHPPAGLTAADVFAINHQTGSLWPTAAILGVLLPSFLLGPFVLAAGLYRSGVVPIWPGLIWALIVVSIFVPPAAPNHDVIAGVALAVAVLGSLGWMGLAIFRKAGPVRSMAPAPGPAPPPPADRQ